MTMQTSLDEARRVKSRAGNAARGQASVVGVGLTKLGDAYAVKINLGAPVPTSAKLPTEIDGVRIIYEVVGQISHG
jgi:hypothetical protein